MTLEDNLSAAAPGSLEDVLRRIRDGSAEAMRELCIEWRHLLDSLALRLMFHRSEADDVVQETLVAVWTNRHTYDPTRPAWPWLAQILRHRCHDAWRGQGTRRKDRGPELPLEYAELVASADLNPSEELERNELVCLAKARLAGLPPALREVVQLAILEEMSEGEIADLLCIAKGTVKSRRHRGLRMLQAASAEDGEDDGGDDELRHGPSVTEARHREGTT